jgi:hypothetical protein
MLWRLFKSINKLIFQAMYVMVIMLATKLKEIKVCFAIYQGILQAAVDEIE